MAVAKPDEMEAQTPEKTDALEEISPELLYKHPLNHMWTLWYFENDKKKSWEENQREIISFDTVEDFWSLYNHIRLASELRQGSDYSLFKKGIRPMWEDSRNVRGGRWLINLDRKQRESDLDHFWLEILLCMIGEAFDEWGDEVCGAVVNIRNKGDKIALCTADASKAKGEAVIAIGKKLKERLKIGPKMQIGYQIHKDTMEKSGSVARNTYTV